LKIIGRAGKEIVAKKKAAYQDDYEGTDKDILSLLSQLFSLERFKYRSQSLMR